MNKKIKIKKKSVTLVLGLVIVILFLSQQVFSYDGLFHKRITEKAISNAAIDAYLKNNLGIEKGVDQKFKGPGSVEALICPQIEQEKTIKEWIEFGGWKEDHPDASNFIGAWKQMGIRTVKHFYDPLTGEALSDFSGLPLEWPLDPFPSRWWAYSRPDNEYSWIKARDYYELALTNQNENDRNTNFAKTFRGLGQVIHLLQDKSVPAHVRNDNHFPLMFNPDKYEDYWKIGNSTFPTASYPVVKLNKFNDYWDDNYGKGLAEFTNHNFLSRDTNFDDYGHKPIYPSPSLGNVSGSHKEPFTFYYYGIPITVQVYYNHWLMEDHYQNSSEENRYLSALSYWDYESMQSDGTHVFSLNWHCHQAYGQYLLPRAVGYSAGLLDYFFRGKLGLEVKASNTPGYYTVTITNNSTEAMNGTFRLFWDNAAGERREIIYSGMLPLIRTLAIGASVSLDIPASAFPSNFSAITSFTGVFRGTLGEEAGAVVGKVIPPPAVPGVTAWLEGWENAEARSYAEQTQDTIYGDSGRWDTVAWGGGGTGLTLEIDSSKKLLTSAQITLWRWQIPGNPSISVEKSTALNIPVTKPNTIFSGNHSGNFDLGGAQFEPTEGGPVSWTEIFLTGTKKVNGVQQYVECHLFFDYSPTTSWEWYESEPVTYRLLGSGSFSIDLYNIFTDGSLGSITIGLTLSPSGFYNSAEQAEYNQDKIVSLTGSYDNLKVTVPSQ